jgi:hypothetical protein
MNTAEIDAIVSEYNQVEQGQQARLWRLFQLLEERKGYRAVKFTGGMWSNCWGLPGRISKPRFVDVLSRTITEVTPGEE